jgi:hypothetical protein
LPISMHGTTLKHEDGKFRITSIGVPRLAFTVAGNVGRGVIASLLCYYGIRFVGYTLDLENLLMNAVALEFVVSVDERLFDALMPRAPSNSFTLGCSRSNSLLSPAIAVSTSVAWSPSSWL